MVTLMSLIPPLDFHTLVAIVIRVLCASFVVSYFSPDEYWQNQEVAYQKLYGQGFVPWEWQEGAEIRSSALMWLSYGVYYMMSLFSSGSWVFMVWAPRIIVLLVAILADACLRGVAVDCAWKQGISHPNRAGLTAMYLYTLSWFSAYSATRTQANSYEAALLIIFVYFAVYTWNRQHATLQSCVSLFLAGLVFTVRPNSALYLLQPCVWQLCSCYSRNPGCLLYICITVLSTLLIIITTDYLYYGKLVFTPLNFLIINLNNNIAALYGVHPRIWLLYEGLPVTQTILFPFTMYAIFTFKSDLCTTMLGLLVYLYGSTALSTIISSHQEYRFQLPSLPFACVLSALKQPSKKQQYVYFAINLVLLGLFSQFHQVGPQQVQRSLYEMQESKGVQVLSSCHSLPSNSLYSKFDSVFTQDCSPLIDKQQHRPVSQSIEAQYGMLYDKYCDTTGITVVVPGKDYYSDHERFLRDPLVFYWLQYYLPVLQKNEKLSLEDQHVVRKLLPSLDHNGVHCEGNKYSYNGAKMELEGIVRKSEIISKSQMHVYHHNILPYQLEFTNHHARSTDGAFDVLVLQHEQSRLHELLSFLQEQNYTIHSVFRDSVFTSDMFYILV